MQQEGPVKKLQEVLDVYSEEIRKTSIGEASDSMKRNKYIFKITYDNNDYFVSRSPHALYDMYIELSYDPDSVGIYKIGAHLFVGGIDEPHYEPLMNKIKKTYQSAILPDGWEEKVDLFKTEKHEYMRHYRQESYEYKKQMSVILRQHCMNILNEDQEIALDDDTYKFSITFETFGYSSTTHAQVSDQLNYSLEKFKNLQWVNPDVLPYFVPFLLAQNERLGGESQAHLLDGLALNAIMQSLKRMPSEIKKDDMIERMKAIFSEFQATQGNQPSELSQYRKPIQLRLDLW